MTMVPHFGDESIEKSIMQVFHPLKLLWVLVQNCPYLNVEHRDILNQWEFKDLIRAVV